MTSLLTSYVLDADVFMQAARHHYAFDIVPSFWDSLVQQAETGVLLSIDRVKAEIDRGKDQLADWANNDFKKWFVSTNNGDVIDSYGRVMTWALGHGQFTESAKADFADADNADAWLIAFALSTSDVVVTHEQFRPDIKARIPIPNVCKELDLQCMDTFEMLRLLGVRF